MTRLTLLLTAVIGALIGGAAVMLASSRLAVPVGDQARIERVVHDYLLSHPEVLPAAMDALRDKEHAKTIADNRAAILEPFGSAWAGSAHPNLTIVEYYDYNCGYCRASLPAIAQLLASDPKLRIVFREFPVLAESSASAARMSLAAAEQGRFKAFHDALYAGGQVSEQSIAAAARIAGVDSAKAAAFTPRADAEIASNMGVARQLGLTGTPSWVIGNHVVSSALPLDTLQKLVAQARAGS
jgi:protein-disulfide isomerase